MVGGRQQLASPRPKRKVSTVLYRVGSVRPWSKKTPGGAGTHKRHTGTRITPVRRSGVLGVEMKTLPVKLKMCPPIFFICVTQSMPSKMRTLLKSQKRFFSPNFRTSS